jgi:ABC-type lipoprotein export system ATPase subunit
LLDGQDFGLSDDQRIIAPPPGGLVFQKMNLLPTLSALENVALPPASTGRSGRRAEAPCSTA